MSNKLVKHRGQHAAQYNALMNVQAYSVRQISEVTGVKIEALNDWAKAREREIREEITKEVIAEFTEKLRRSEDHASFVNLLISMYAIKMTWGYTKSQERFLGNLNAAQGYIRRVGVRKAFNYMMQDCGTLLEFDDFEIEDELQELERLSIKNNREGNG